MNHCPEVRAALGRRQASYDPQRKVLTVIAMAKLSHESVFRLASLFYADMVDAGLLTRSERRLIQSCLNPRCWQGRPAKVPAARLKLGMNFLMLVVYSRIDKLRRQYRQSYMTSHLQKVIPTFLRT